jgi:hypothetical protein
MNRRIGCRFLCADMVEARWKDRAGRLRRAMVNLEDISRSGACLQLETPLPNETPVVVCCEGVDLRGTVRYCVYRDSSYFVGVEFEEGTQWSSVHFRPQHLLDPLQLVRRASRRSRTSA